MNVNRIWLSLDENGQINDVDLTLYPYYQQCYYISLSQEFFGDGDSSSFYIRYLPIHSFLADDNSVTPTPIQSNMYVDFSSYVRKPFDFNNKTALFFGDSITYGVITTADGGQIANPVYGKQFCDKVSATFINKGSSGAILTKQQGYSNSIHSIIENSSEQADIVFIMGGINDWQTNINLTDFAQGVSDLCATVNSKYSSNIPIIWITPVNASRSFYDVDLDDIIKYRYILTKTVMANDTYKRFSIIQGSEMPFPLRTDDSNFISLMYGDGLHPSQIGHDIIAAHLMKLLA